MKKQREKWLRKEKGKKVTKRVWVKVKEQGREPRSREWSVRGQ